MRKLHVRAVLCAATLAFVAASPALAQPANDSCATPEAISGLGSFPFDTTSATSTFLGISCGVGDAADDVWFCWTAASSGAVSFNLCGGDVTHDTVMAAYVGCGCPSDFSEMTCNDDSCDLQSRISFIATAGQPYLIRVGGFGEGDAGPGTLNVTGGNAPPNDVCDSPAAISGFGSFPFDSTFATSTSLAISCGTGDIANDVWFCWTATSSGPVVVDLCGGDVSHDSTIAAYAGCACPADNSEITCNDDSCGLQSRISFLAVNGQAYLLRIGGFSEGEVGTGSVNISSGIVHTDTFNGHTYHLFAAGTWTSAEAIAVMLGGHLVTVNDQGENDFLQFGMLGFDGRDRRAWLGYNDAASEGNFVWVSGESSSYTNWNAGEPNNANGNENYSEMLGSNGQWNDQPDGGNGFVQFGVAEIGSPPCTADFNHDHVVNSQDFFDFLTAFFSIDPSADFNHDGTINSQDFFDFLTAFFNGC